MSNKNHFLFQKYLKEQGREGVTITTLHQGEEDDDFKAHFSSWDPDMWANQIAEK